jgi:hypothetical protein
MKSLNQETNHRHKVILTAVGSNGPHSVQSLAKVCIDGRASHTIDAFQLTGGTDYSKSRHKMPSMLTSKENIQQCG